MRTENAPAPSHAPHTGKAARRTHPPARPKTPPPIPLPHTEDAAATRSSQRRRFRGTEPFGYSKVSQSILTDLRCLSRAVMPTITPFVPAICSENSDRSNDTQCA